MSDTNGEPGVEVAVTEGAAAAAETEEPAAAEEAAPIEEAVTEQPASPAAALFAKMEAAVEEGHAADPPADPRPWDNRAYGSIFEAIYQHFTAEIAKLRSELGR